MKASIVFGGFCVFLLATPSASANSPIVVDGAGRAIGYLLGGSGYCQSSDGFAVISKTGYFGCVRSQNGTLDANIYPPGGQVQGGRRYYNSSDCTGTIFLYGQYSGGAVVWSPYYGPLMVVSGQSSTFVVTNSYDDTGTCNASAGSMNGSAAQRNDPVVTGLFAGPYASPLSTEVLPDSALYDEIFFDGFGDGY